MGFNLWDIFSTLPLRFSTCALTLGVYFLETATFPVSNVGEETSATLPSLHQLTFPSSQEAARDSKSASVEDKNKEALEHEDRSKEVLEQEVENKGAALGQEEENKETVKCNGNIKKPRVQGEIGKESLGHGNTNRDVTNNNQHQEIDINSCLVQEDEPNDTMGQEETKRETFWQEETRRKATEKAFGSRERPYEGDGKEDEEVICYWKVGEKSTEIQKPAVPIEPSYKHTEVTEEMVTRLCPQKSETASKTVEIVDRTLETNKNTKKTEIYENSSKYMKEKDANTDAVEAGRFNVELPYKPEETPNIKIDAGPEIIKLTKRHYVKDIRLQLKDSSSKPESSGAFPSEENSLFDSLPSMEYRKYEKDFTKLVDASCASLSGEEILPSSLSCEEILPSSLTGEEILPSSLSGEEILPPSLPATSARRRFLEAAVVGREEKVCSVEGREEEQVSSVEGREEQVSSVVGREEHVSSVEGREEEQVISVEGREEQVSSVGSSLVGESVTSWLHTTQDSLEDRQGAGGAQVIVAKEEEEVEERPNSRVTFCHELVRVLATYSAEEYDRTNDTVDPAASSAEYEMEKRLEKLEAVTVELHKGPEGLGLSIVGLGLGGGCEGSERLGIYIKGLSEGGVAERDGRLRVNDQIIQVNGESLVGVTQAQAASVLRGALGRVVFQLGREPGGEGEVAELLREQVRAGRGR